MSAVIYGKHPSYGDFLAHGLPGETFRILDEWLEAQLPELKADLGEGWEPAWQNAPVLRFWLGPKILGVPLTGLMIASFDKVGRRYPLIFAVSDTITPPPIHSAHDGGLYDALWAHISGPGPEQSMTKRGGEALLDGFQMPEVRGVPWELGQDTNIWGHREDGDMARLLQDAATADADKAQLLRSHWWHPETEDRSTGWLATDGLPDAAALRWLLTDRVRVEEPPEPEMDPEATAAGPDQHVQDQEQAPDTQREEVTSDD